MMFSRSSSATTKGDQRSSSLLWSVGTIASVAAATGFLVWKGYVLYKKRKDKEEVEITKEQFESEEDFDAIKAQLVYDLLKGGSTAGGSTLSSRFLAAEQLIRMYPNKACCHYAFAESCLLLMGYDEAVAASKRLLEIVPNNSLAQNLHDHCQKRKTWFESEQQKAVVRLPQDDKVVVHRWKPVTGIPQDFCHNTTGSSSVPTLVKVRNMWSWIREYKKDLGKVLIEIMHREWAVETGRLEDLYILSKGATRSLITQGISSHAITSDPARSKGIREGTADIHTIEMIIKDQEEVVKTLTSSMDITKEMILDLQLSFTKTARFTKTTIQFENGTSREIEVLIRRGRFKNQPNFPTTPRHTDKNQFHSYCPVDKVDEEIDCLISFVTKHQGRQQEGGDDHNVVAPEVLAAWLHHRFVQIHPFHAGNGRVARSLASLVLIKANLLPFTVKLRDRHEYLETLALADRGDLNPHVRFIGRQQKETLLAALSCCTTGAGDHHSAAVAAGDVLAMYHAGAFDDNDDDDDNNNNNYDVENLGAFTKKIQEESKIHVQVLESSIGSAAVSAEAKVVPLSSKKMMTPKLVLSQPHRNSRTLHLDDDNSSTVSMDRSVASESMAPRRRSSRPTRTSLTSESMAPRRSSRPTRTSLPSPRLKPEMSWQFNLHSL